MPDGSNGRRTPYPEATAVLQRVLSQRAVKGLLLALLLIGGPAMACEWKWEITLYSGGKTWKEEIVASNRQDAERAAMARNPHAKVIARNPVCR